VTTFDRRCRRRAEIQAVAKEGAAGAGETEKAEGKAAE
jgi:hypothetical protein